MRLKVDKNETVVLQVPKNELKDLEEYLSGTKILDAASTQLELDRGTMYQERHKYNKAIVENCLIRQALFAEMSMDSELQCSFFVNFQYPSFRIENFHSNFGIEGIDLISLLHELERCLLLIQEEDMNFKVSLKKAAVNFKNK